MRAEPAFGFTVLALTIIFAPLLAQKIHLPGLIGLLIGGVIIGPEGFSVLDSFDGIKALGDLGVLYLIFLTGLGLDMKTFEVHRRMAVSFGLTTAALPWALGTIVALNEGFDTKTAVFIGSFWASFTLVSYGSVTDYGLTRNPSMAATVAASSITDTIGLVTLAVVVGSETGGGVGTGLVFKIAAGLLLTAAYGLFVLPWVTRWFFGGLGQERELRFMMILAGFTSAAVVADLLSIEPLIGAFFAGLGLNRLVPNASPLMARIDFFGNALFIPAFLVSVGFIIDPSVMFSGSTLRLAALFSLALIVGKALAAIGIGRRYRFSWSEIGLMFSLSAAQAAATLASTIIGLDIGLYGDEVVNAVMVVVVISLLVSGFGSSYFAPRVVPAELEERRLGETVVVPVPMDEDVTAALRLAGQTAEADGGVVVPLVIALSEEPEQVEKRRAHLQELKATLRRLGLTSDPELRVDRSIAGAVERVSLERDASLIVLNSPGRGDVRTLMFGGTNDEIAAATDRPIAVTSLARERFERVLVVVDETDLEGARLVDAQMAFSLAHNLVDGGDMELVFGPVGPDALDETAIEMPEQSLYLWGAQGRADWMTKNVQETDIVIIPARGNPFALLRHFDGPDRSVVAVATRQEANWYSSEGALGVSAPRTRIR
ncbi:MAG: cation:proton antiporter [Acidimicrobiales bacterium]